tara:strand:+ start:503 stop:1492 length:990 start_codon:yes stop_codon:yes gene_type:complete
MTYKIAIIGAGLSGVTLARLIKKNFTVDIFEKSRGVGGRMSTRKELSFVFDHGAQYFNTKTSEFRKFIIKSCFKKTIQPWKFKLAFFNGDKLENLKVISDKDKFLVGVPNMDSIIKFLSKKCNIVLNTRIDKITKIKNKWILVDHNKKNYGQYDWIVLTMPAEQTFSIIPKNVSFYSSIQNIKMKGCFSLMVGSETNLKLDFDAANFKEKDISWMVVNGSKPQRKENFSLLINSSFQYAKKNINTPETKILNHLLKESSNVLNYDLSNSKLIKLHKWKYVEAINHPIEDFFIDFNKQIAVCGDWCVNSRVEGAFTSAKELSSVILRLVR